MGSFFANGQAKFSAPDDDVRVTPGLLDSGFGLALARRREVTTVREDSVGVLVNEGLAGPLMANDYEGSSKILLD